MRLQMADASLLGPDSYKLDLPRVNGEVDWNTLGNILTAHMLGEVVCASYVNPKYGAQAEKKDLKANTDWEYAYEKHDVTVLKKRLRDSPTNTCFMGRGVISAPMKEVAMFLKKVESTFVWDKFLVEAKYLKILSESMSHTDYLGYQYFETTQCFVTIKRDMLYYLRCVHIDGKYVQAALSVMDPDYPPHSSITRVELYKGTGFVLEPYRGSDSNTLVHYLGNTDLKGLPQFILYQVLKRHPMSIHYMRRHFQSLQTVRQEQLALRTLELSLSKSGQYFEESVPVDHFLSVPPLNQQKQAASEPVLSQNPSESSNCDLEEKPTLKSSLPA